MGQPPIFIHSLFRSGSTYLFEVFRRSGAGYWCYQEPLNEILLRASGDPGVLDEPPQMLASRLRHPALSRPYFWEFKPVLGEIRAALTPDLIYENFFSTHADSSARLAAYFATLAAKAQGRPVFQECRTFARSHQLAASLGGVHLYLWRNPWDQWWSGKVHPYFDLVYLLILNAREVPDVVARLRAAVRFAPRQDADLDGQIDQLWGQLLPAADSYLVFYCLWCLALHLNAKSADGLINIDSLATSAAYRAETATALERRSLRGLDFADCTIPQGHYAERDTAFFREVESRAHALFVDAGLAEVPELVRELRAAHPPLPGTFDPGEQLSRHRALTLGLVDDYAESRRYRVLIDAERADLRRAVATSQAALERTERALEEIKESWAWRIATPARVLERWIRSGRARKRPQPR